MTAGLPAKANVVVIGGGLLGLSTAHALAERGRDILLLEARDGVGQEASFANGAMLTPSMADPWNAPGIWRHAVRSLFGGRSAIDVRWAALPGAARWGLDFLRAATSDGYARAIAANFALARYSTGLTLEFARARGFDLSASGTMKVFSDGEALAAARSVTTGLADKGLACRVLDRDGVIAVESRLADAAVSIAGGLYFPDDAIGDAHSFCRVLQGVLEASSVARIFTGVGVKRIIADGGRAYAVETTQGRIEARDIVVAAGLASPGLTNPLGLRLSIGPVKGYSETIDLPEDVAPLRVGIIDEVRHTGIVPLGRRIRLVGTAEIAGHDPRIRPVGIARLRASLAALLPALARQLDHAPAQPWAGLRPVSSDGVPRIGPSRLAGLWVNTGHSHLGWTEAMGSGALLADMMTGARPAIDPSPYRP
ncbi:FAD-dependent oxidoreductase [Rhizorhabdus wittichii]|uniref:FAD-dependent oxidoreductase n=1 Tax=Rhizorhabdus wittichii TaxID=160791 RepID=A0A975CZG8_9SPHN|nr:FAD-dependent oxidoreductase [Rhizorhabdus wittichii]QTH20197.1 FAD-dependent oxidoreductase [Rhizorhabdus wittichii]